MLTPHHPQPRPQGFAIIMEPYDERLPHIPDPVLQLRCGSAYVTDGAYAAHRGACSTDTLTFICSFAPGCRR